MQIMWQHSRAHSLIKLHTFLLSYALYFQQEKRANLLSIVMVFTSTKHKSNYWRSTGLLISGTKLCLIITVQTLKWDTWKEIVESQPFLKPKIFKIFCKQSAKIHSSTMCPLKTLKAFELTWPLREQPSNLWILWVPLQKTWESFVFRKCCDWTMFFQVSQFECLYCKETSTLLLNKI